MGIASSKSSPLPWGTPSMMSMRTTSASSLAAIQCAAVAPTFPEPTMLTLLRIMFPFWNQPQRHRVELILRTSVPSVSSVVKKSVGCGGKPGVHILDDVVAKLAGLDLGRPFHQALEVIGNLLLLNGCLHGVLDQACRLAPAQEIEHHHARKND